MATISTSNAYVTTTTSSVNFTSNPSAIISGNTFINNSNTKSTIKAEIFDVNSFSNNDVKILLSNLGDTELKSNVESIPNNSIIISSNSNGNSILCKDNSKISTISYKLKDNEWFKLNNDSLTINEAKLKNYVETNISSSNVKVFPISNIWYNKDNRRIKSLYPNNIVYSTSSEDADKNTIISNPTYVLPGLYKLNLYVNNKVFDASKMIDIRYYGIEYPTSINNANYIIHPDISLANSNTEYASGVLYANKVNYYLKYSQPFSVTAPGFYSISIKHNTRANYKIYIDKMNIDYQPTYDHQYLTIEFLEAGDFQIKRDYTLTPDSIAQRNISYAVNNTENWISNTMSNLKQSADTIDIFDLVAGDKIYLKGDNNGLFSGYNVLKFKFNSNAKVKIYGNIMSLLWGDNFISNMNEIKYSYTFIGIFSGLSHLVDASNLILPATVLSEGCYCDMFRGCSMLTCGPELLAQKLVKNCYQGMFNNCSSLNYIKCLGIDLGNNSFRMWTQSVAKTGIFVYDKDVTWPKGDAGIPADWKEIKI